MQRTGDCRNNVKLLQAQLLWLVMVPDCWVCNTSPLVWSCKSPGMPDTLLQSKDQVHDIWPDVCILLSAESTVG